MAQGPAPPFSAPSGQQPDLLFAVPGMWIGWELPLRGRARGIRRYRAGGVASGDALAAAGEGVGTGRLGVGGRHSCSLAEVGELLF